MFSQLLAILAWFTEQNCYIFVELYCLQQNIYCSASTRIVLFVKRSERENNWGVIGYVSEQNYTESMPEASHEEGKKKAHNADGPGGDGDDVNNGLMVVTIW